MNPVHIIRFLFVLLLSSQAFAQMRLSDDGQGEVLIFPFYSAASGEESSFIIRNHTSHAKALYLRFREGLSGAEVLSFNVYLAPRDAFEASIIKNPKGEGAAIASLDSSCTVPNLGTLNVSPFEGFTTQVEGGTLRIQPFVNFDYLNDSESGVRRTLVGSLEVIEMGQWPEATNSIGASAIKVVALARASAEGDRSGCDALSEAWSLNGTWYDNPRIGATSSWDGGGVSGEMLITTARGKLSASPVVIAGFAREKRSAEYHVSPGSTEAEWPSPSLANGNLSVQHPFDGRLYEATSGLEAISMLLAKTEISVQSSGVQIDDDRTVIVSFPTKKLHTQPQYPPVRAPFSSRWDPDASSACEAVAFSEGRSTLGAFPYSGATINQLCGAINILAYPNSPGNLAGEAEWLLGNAPPLAQYPWVMSFAKTSFEEEGTDFDRVINGGGHQSMKGMPVIVIPLAVRTPAGSWVKESVSIFLDSSDTCNFGCTTSVSSDGAVQCVGFGCDYTDSGSTGGSSTSNTAGYTDSGSTGGSSTSSTGGCEIGFSPCPDATPTDSGDGDTNATTSTDTADAGHFSRLLLEIPGDGSILAGIGTIQGWALDESGDLRRIDFYIDGQYQGKIAHGDTRGDVGAAYPSVYNSRYSGFSAAFNYGQLSSGWHELEVVATDSSGKVLRSSASFYVERFSGGSFLTGDSAPKASGATSCRMVGNQIRCSGISAGGSTASVWLEWTSATQNFEIIRID